MKHITLMAVALVALLSSCQFIPTQVIAKEDNSPMTTKDYDLKDFDKIKCYVPVRITYVQSDSTPSIAIKGHQNTVAKIKVENNDGTLELSREKGSWYGNNTVDVTIHSPKLTYLELTSASTFKSQAVSAESFKMELSSASTAEITNFTANEASLDASGASTLKLPGAKIGKLDLEASGASGATVSGKVHKASLDASGASTIKAQQLQADDVEADASGASGIRCHAIKTLSLDASGASSIQYSGNAAITSSEVSGASSVSKK